MLALIAGKGALPGILAKASPKPILVAALDEFVPDELVPEITFCIEQLGSFLIELRSKGVSEVCFAGAIRRPPLDASKVDPATMPLVPKMMAAMKQGDDHALRTVLGFFEEAGFEIKSAQQICPDLLLTTGSKTKTQPNRDWDEDAIRARDILNSMSLADVGQSCVVHKGQVLAVEASFGTDWMLESLLNRPDGSGGIMFKGPKVGQDTRIDLPTIGPDTIRKASEGGLSGVVIEEGGVMVLDQTGTIAAADKSGLFLWVRKS